MTAGMSRVRPTFTTGTSFWIYPSAALLTSLKMSYLMAMGSSRLSMFMAFCGLANTLFSKERMRLAGR